MCTPLLRTDAQVSNLVQKWFGSKPIIRYFKTYNRYIYIIIYIIILSLDIFGGMNLCDFLAEICFKRDEKRCCTAHNSLCDAQSYLLGSTIERRHDDHARRKEPKVLYKCGPQGAVAPCCTQFFHVFSPEIHRGRWIWNPCRHRFVWRPTTCAELGSCK